MQCFFVWKRDLFQEQGFNREHVKREEKKYLSLQHMVEVSYVAQGELQYFDLGELLVWRKCGQELAEGVEGHVECLHPHAFSSGVRSAVLLCGTSSSPPLLSGEHLTSVPRQLEREG